MASMSNPWLNFWYMTNVFIQIIMINFVFSHFCSTAKPTLLVSSVAIISYCFYFVSYKVYLTCRGHIQFSCQPLSPNRLLVVNRLQQSNLNWGRSSNWLMQRLLPVTTGYLIVMRWARFCSMAGQRYLADWDMNVNVRLSKHTRCATFW